MADFTIALDERPDHAPTLLERAAAYVAAGRLPEAQADFGRAVELAPDDPDALYGLARAHALRGAVAAATGALTWAIAVDPPRRAQAAADPAFAGLRANATFQALAGPPPPRRRLMTPATRMAHATRP